MQEASYAKADKNGCYAQTSNMAHTVAIVDSSEPRSDQTQTRDLMAAFKQTYMKGLNFNERFSIVTTAENAIGSVFSPSMSFCRGAHTPDELLNVGAASATVEFVYRESMKFYQKTFEPTLAKIFTANPDDDARQRRESPIFEQIQSVARATSFSEQINNRHLILVSDLIQHTSELQFCTTKGHLPKFKKLKASQYFSDIKPRSLSGVDVQVYMLIRPGYGDRNLPYCSESELRTFWVDYFADAGARNVEVIRLRMGNQSQSNQ